MVLQEGKERHCKKNSNHVFRTVAVVPERERYV